MVHACVLRLPVCVGLMLPGVGYPCVSPCWLNVTQDATLLIQTRKVQYQCMSKLSAKELANRGHMFLANGDKKKSNVQPMQSSPDTGMEIPFSLAGVLTVKILSVTISLTLIHFFSPFFLH